ncbi:MAG TPA: polyribonucleotide nucleotidyltransferase [Bacteroidetes bacterium]|nr:polyribonucleotide nucleotidyltransferase [Bacteroidota bacterium]
MTVNIGTTRTFDFGDGKQISIETGKLAKQAHGSVVLRMGNTMLLATVVGNQDAREGTDFLPLSVDYQEKFASVGRIPGGFLKREARLSDYEILICRIVDRAIRPLFPEDYHADIQVQISLISSDQNILPDALAGLAASAAIMLSDIPFNGPMAEVRVARIDGKYVINPYKDQLATADIDFIVAGTEHDINMVEGEANEISEHDFVEAIKVAHDYIKKLCALQHELCEAVGGRKPAREYNHEDKDEELAKKIHAETYDKVYAVAKSRAPKDERKAAFAQVLEDFVAQYSEEEKATLNMGLVKKYYHEVEYHAMRDMILNEGQRLDGRKLDEVRSIWSEVDYLPAAHGSAVFTRGETQSLTSVTLGSKMDEQMLDSPMLSGYNKFILHYNFPSFSTGEARPNRGPGRREIGHGNLAMRGLKKMLPGQIENPYTIRIVSDILESNGSSSMATVCAGSLALMDAGIKMREAVSGIAMGLVTSKDNSKYRVLSDILGDEDHLGDMDFKVVGTKNGIVACQMDIKIDGLKWAMVEEALNQAKAGRLHILGEMNKTLDAPRPEYKPHTPRIETIIVDTEFIGAIIGPGGKIIQGIQKDTGATISIEEKDNKGYVEIATNNAESMNKAVSIIRGIVSVPEVGEVYTGKVKSVVDFGAFVEILPGKEGLLHISEISWNRIEKMDGVLTVGQEIQVKLIEVDKKTGKYRLSHKVLTPRPEKSDDEPRRREDRPRERS